MQVESGMPAERRQAGRARVLEIRGATPQALTESLVQALAAEFAGDGTREAWTVEPISGTGATIAGMLDALVGDMLAAIDGGNLAVSAAELSQVMSTEDGFRAWGYVWLGTPVADGPPPLRAEPVRVTGEPSGEMAAILTLEPADARTDASGAGR